MNAEIQRMLQTAGEFVMRVPGPCDPGPLCSICNDRCMSLLANPGCGHMACENCWSRWLAVQAPRCLDAKRVTIRCVGGDCHETASGGLWLHAGTRSEEVRDAETLLARRRRL